MRTSGLNRLEEIRKEGRSLFQGDRTPGPVEHIHPLIAQTNFDPRRVRGVWVPEVGLLSHCALVRQVYASPLMAAMDVSLQRPGEITPFHADEFPDGTVAYTLGQHLEDEDLLAQALRSARGLEDGQPLGTYFVNVLAKDDFPPDRLGYPVPGQWVSTEPVRVRERIELTAGDLRSIGALLDGWLAPFHDPEVARAAAFTGLFRKGGHLQFCPDTGQLQRHRVPSDTDRKISVELTRERAGSWLDRLRARTCSIASSQESALRSRTQTAHQKLVSRSIGVLLEKMREQGAPALAAHGRTRSFARALKFVEDNCTRSVTVAEISEAAGISRSQLHVIFRAVTGLSPLAYVAERRLDEAERLLRETRLTVGEISERCGFAEQTSLARSLKSRRGVTPSAIRNDGF